MAITATGLAIGAFALSAVGAIAQGQAAKNKALFEAQVTRQQGQRAEDVAGANADSFDKKISRQLAAARTKILAGGGELSGSSLLSLEDFAAEAKVDSLRIRQGGEIANIRANQQASLLTSSGKSAANAGFVRAGATLLQGFSGFKFGSTTGSSPVSIQA